MLRCALITVALLLLTEAAQPESAFCRSTVAAAPAYTPPAPYPQSQSAHSFWYGSDELWTYVPWNAVWHTKDNVDKQGGYATKLVVWHRGFDWRKEREPNFTFAGTRLDAKAPEVSIRGATPVFITAASAMMIGVHLPTVGCWALTAHYHEHVLGFVVSVEP